MKTPAIALIGALLFPTVSMAQTDLAALSGPQVDAMEHVCVEQRIPRLCWMPGDLGRPASAATVCPSGTPKVSYPVAWQDCAKIDAEMSRRSQAQAAAQKAADNAVAAKMNDAATARGVWLKNMLGEKP